MPNLLGDSQNLLEGFRILSPNPQEILFVLKSSWGHANVVPEFSRRYANNFSGSLRMVDSSPRDIYTLSSIYQRTSQKKKTLKLENRGLRCHSFSEILNISENLWHEMPKNLYLSKTDGVSFRFKNQKQFLFRPR